MVKTYFFIAVISLALVGQAQAEVIVRGANGVEVTVEDVLVVLRQGSDEVQEGMAADGQRLSQIARTIFVEKQLAQEAESQGLTEDPNVVAALERAKRRALAEITLKELVQNALPESFEAAAREQYVLNPEQYMAPARVKASHILVSTDERNDVEAKALAEQYRADVLSGEVDFSEYARDNSEDSSVQGNGGHLGWFTADEMVAPFSEAAFAAEPGTITEPVKSRFGWHVIRVEDKAESEQMPFDAVRGQIENRLRSAFIRRTRSELMAQYAADENAEVFPDALQSIEQAITSDQ